MSTGSLTATNIANTFDVNLIYARQLFHSVGKDSTLDDVQKLINNKPKPFVKWVGGVVVSLDLLLGKGSDYLGRLHEA